MDYLVVLTGLVFFSSGAHGFLSPLSLFGSSFLSPLSMFTPLIASSAMTLAKYALKGGSSSKSHSHSHSQAYPYHHHGGDPMFGESQLIPSFGGTGFENYNSLGAEPFMMAGDQFRGMIPPQYVIHMDSNHDVHDLFNDEGGKEGGGEESDYSYSQKGVTAETDGVPVYADRPTKVQHFHSSDAIISRAKKYPIRQNSVLEKGANTKTRHNPKYPYTYFRDLHKHHTKNRAVSDPNEASSEHVDYADGYRGTEQPHITPSPSESSDETGHASTIHISIERPHHNSPTQPNPYETTSSSGNRFSALANKAREISQASSIRINIQKTTKKLGPQPSLHQSHNEYPSYPANYYHSSHPAYGTPPHIHKQSSSPTPYAQTQQIYSYSPQTPYYNEQQSGSSYTQQSSSDSSYAPYYNTQQSSTSSSHAPYYNTQQSSSNPYTPYANTRPISESNPNTSYSQHSASNTKTQYSNTQQSASSYPGTPYTQQSASSYPETQYSVMQQSATSVPDTQSSTQQRSVSTPDTSNSITKPSPAVNSPQTTEEQKNSSSSSHTQDTQDKLQTSSSNSAPYYSFPPNPYVAHPNNYPQLQLTTSGYRYPTSAYVNFPSYPYQPPYGYPPHPYIYPYAYNQPFAYMQHPYGFPHYSHHNYNYLPQHQNNSTLIPQHSNSSNSTNEQINANVNRTMLAQEISKTVSTSVVPENKVQNVTLSEQSL